MVPRDFALMSSTLSPRISLVFRPSPTRFLLRRNITYILTQGFHQLDAKEEQKAQLLHYVGDQLGSGGYPDRHKSKCQTLLNDKD
jgi:hypothetical protein